MACVGLELAVQQTGIIMLCPSADTFLVSCFFAAVGTDDLQSEDMGQSTECKQVELARLLFWLMVVGYTLRTLEVRFDMEQTMMLPTNI